jgi:hypothetical protein
MGKSMFRFYFTSPMPSTLEDAKHEIASLRNQLNVQNQKLERMAEAKELMRRCLMGSIRAMEKRFNIQVIVDRGLPQGEVQLKHGDAVLDTIVVGAGE